jgi:hypothetical protein
MRAVMVRFFSLEADPPTGLSLPLQRDLGWRGSFELTGARVYEGRCPRPTCSMDHKISNLPKPIVEFVYVRIIEARSGCAYGGSSRVLRIIISAAL